jgi:beta-xylosidase
MDPRYNMIGGNRYGGGVWAPAIRRHAGLFYVYFPTPGEGIFVSTAPAIDGPWSPPAAVIEERGLEDPCPFWDDDGSAWLIHSKVGAGPLILHRMSSDGMHVLDQGKVIIDDSQHFPFLEGPKLYKRNGTYYIFAPFGGVGTGSQAVFRSQNIYGPWENRVVLEEGSTKINGPHQGGYVETPDGQGWFIHFQASAAHGRIVHLEPVQWQDGWPVIGEPIQGSTTGEPVPFGPMPEDTTVTPLVRPQTSDEFTAAALGPQWEWNHNPDNTHWSLTDRTGYLRLMPMHAGGLLDARNTLTESMQDNSFQLTIRIDLSAMRSGAHAGLAIFEKDASGLEVVQHGDRRELNYFHLPEKTPGIELPASVLQLRVSVHDDSANYFYSEDDGRTFRPLGSPTQIHSSWWKGPRPSLFAYTTDATEPGAVDFDWVRYEPTGTNPW